jgi:GPI ethanolamine phosphate transferase 3 subunit O
MFAPYLTRVYPYPSFNVRDLDTLDNEVKKDLLNELALNNFTLLIGHIIGVDHAGHTFSASHSEIERKLNDSEAIVREVIEKMDSDTVLIVCGDHGMTDDGNHGGASKNELRSALFAYHKSGFPMRQNYELIDDRVKQIDIAAIISSILELPVPFQNLGVMHPSFFFPNSNDNAKD